MNPDVLEFFSKLAEDPKLRGKFKGKSLDECYETAVKSGNWGFTKEEFLDFLRKAGKQDEASNQKRPINDEELSSVSGGSYTRANQYLDLFNVFVLLLNNIGYLYGAITNCKNKADEDTLREREKKREKFEELLNNDDKAKKILQKIKETNNYK